MSPARATGVAGSYDRRHASCRVQYTRAAGASLMSFDVEIQAHPTAATRSHATNDGPPAPGKPLLGPFYELETSSPALSLGAGERYTHIHRTFHFVGLEEDLDRICRATLGVGLGDVATALSPGR